MKINRIAYSKAINEGKYQQLVKQVRLLGILRSEIWQQFGSISGVDIKNDRVIRDKWLKEKRKFSVLSTPWKETLRDAYNNIKTHREATKAKIFTRIQIIVKKKKKSCTNY